jgi:hypothetical protein
MAGNGACDAPTSPTASVGDHSIHCRQAHTHDRGQLGARHVALRRSGLHGGCSGFRVWVLSPHTGI